MSESCACLEKFPAREFKTARDADAFMSRVRMSPVFRFVATEEGDVARELFRCRTCGRDWVCRVPAVPPYTWGPAVGRTEPEAPQVQVVAPPSPRARAEEAIPVASAVFLEPGGLKREQVGPFTVLYEEEVSPDVHRVLRALTAWRPGLSGWAANAGLLEVEVEIGARLAKTDSVFAIFEKSWPREQINPAWRAMRPGKAWRPVHLRGVRQRTPAGFFGDYYLVLVDLRLESVAAWMMREVRTAP